MFGSLHDDAIKSYRYLRLAMVVLVVALFASVLIERAGASCWEESISNYYYTPVHAVFVAALVAIGVCLVAIKGSTGWEDSFLNVAGMLAPVVAFVPTSRPDVSCSRHPYGPTDAEPFVNNNVLALAIGGVVAVGVAYFIARRARKAAPLSVQVERAVGVGLLISLLLIAAGLVWYWADRDTFLERAHGFAAAAMFLAIGIVAAINASTAQARKYRTFYAGVVAFMVAAGVGVFIGRAVTDEWRHDVLWIETLEIVPFAVFWTAQTIEHWNIGIDPPATAAQRQAEARRR